MENAEEALRLNEDKYRGLLENLNDIIFAVALDGKIDYINPVVEALFGFTPAELIGRHYSALIFKDDLPLVERAFRDILGGQLYPSEYRIVTKSGEIRWANSSSCPILEKGRVTGIRGRLTDITARKSMEEEIQRLNESLERQVTERTAQLNETVQRLEKEIAERKQAEKSLRESEDRFRGMSNASFEGIMFHEQGVILDVNPAFVRLFGYDQPEELIGQDCVALLTPESGTRIRERIRRREGGPQEVACRRKDGSTFAGEADSRPVKYKDRDAWVVSCRDISERKQVEAVLRESEERYRTLAEAANDMIFIIDREGRVAYVNKCAAQSLGKRPEDIVGQPHAAFFSGDVGAGQAASLRRVFETGEPYYVERPTQVHDSELWLGTWLAPIRGRDGTVAAVLGVARDITDRKLAEEKFKRNHAFLRHVIDAVPSMIFVKDRKGRYLLVNKVITRFYEKTAAQMLGKTVADLTAQSVIKATTE